MKMVMMLRLIKERAYADGEQNGAEDEGTK